MERAICEVRTGGQALYTWRRFVAVGTLDAPEGCQVSTCCPLTDLGAVPGALVGYVAGAPMAEDGERELAAASLLEGLWRAAKALGELYPALAAGLGELAS